MLALALAAIIIPLAAASANAVDVDSYRKPFCGTGWDWTETAPRMIVHADKSCVEVPIENKASFSITTGIGGGFPNISSGIEQGENCPSAADQKDGLCDLYPVQLGKEGEPYATVNATLKPGYAGNVAFDDWYSPTAARDTYAGRCSKNLATADVEIMAWLAHPGDLVGSPSGYTTWLDGRRWRVLTWETGTGCPAGEGWRLLIFEAPKVTDGTLVDHNLKLNVFSGYAIGKGWMKGSWYLDAIDLGFEEHNSVAGDAINSFSLTGGAK